MSTLQTGTMTSAEFERWLALQEAMGWRVKTPESVDKIRAAFKRGAKVAPFRLIEGGGR